MFRCVWKWECGARGDAGVVDEGGVCGVEELGSRVGSPLGISYTG